MNTYPFKFAICFVTCFVSTFAVGQDSGQYRIGIVNIKEVFDSYDRQKAEYEDLQRERDDMQVDIDQLSERITQNKKRYETERDNMSVSERLELEELVESDYGRYKSEFKRLQEGIDRREKRLLESLFKDIHKAVAEVGAKGNYHLILEGGQSGRSGVLYSSTTLNMTQQVIEHVNRSYRRNSS